MLERNHFSAVRILERFGGASRIATLLTFAIHFLHALFSLTNYIYWARRQEARVGASLVRAYIAMDVVACVAYLFGASVFYMWAWRFPEPEEVAKRRRIYGIGINLLFADIPIFVIETMMVQKVNFDNGVQGFTYVVTCVSCAYSLLRFWTFWMVRMIKIRLPRRYNERYSIAQPKYANHNTQDLDRMMERVGEEGEEMQQQQDNNTNNDDNDDDSENDYDDNENEDFYGPSASRYYNNDNPNNRNDAGFRTPPGTTIIGANNCNEDGDDYDNDGGRDPRDYYNNNSYTEDEPYNGEGGGGASGNYGNTRARRQMGENNNNSTPARATATRPPVALSSSKKSKKKNRKSGGGAGNVVI